MKKHMFFASTIRAPRRKKKRCVSSTQTEHKANRGRPLLVPVVVLLVARSGEQKGEHEGPGAIRQPPPTPHTRALLGGSARTRFTHL